MELDLSTPTLLFPAITLLLLAYTNRYLALASVVRDLCSKGDGEASGDVMGQIETLYGRIHLIRRMQMAGILSLMCCVISMTALWLHKPDLGAFCFFISLLLMVASLFLAFVEVTQSGKALQLELKEFKQRMGERGDQGS